MMKCQIDSVFPNVSLKVQVNFWLYFYKKIDISSHLTHSYLWSRLEFSIYVTSLLIFVYNKKWGFRITLQIKDFSWFQSLFFFSSFTQLQNFTKKKRFWFKGLNRRRYCIGINMFSRFTFEVFEDFFPSR
jgi:hypothetical protein